MQVDPKHNLDAITVGTGEFSFAAGATSAAAALVAGYLDFGNITALTPQPSITTEDHIGSYRGVRRSDRTIATQTALEYQLKCDEWSLSNLRILFGAEDALTGHTQTIKTAANADAWPFNTTASGTTKWYDVLFTGERIRNISALTIATLTEGTDFEVDQLLGRVRFLVNQTTALTAVVTAPAITATDEGYFAGLTPFGDLVKQGYGRLTIYDQYDHNKVVLDHVDFSCEVRADNLSEVSGAGVTDMTMVVKVTADPGKILVRGANL